MTSKNFSKKFTTLLTKIHCADAARGAIYDEVLELIEFMSRMLLKIPNAEIAHLAELYGLHEELEAGMPTDSKKIADYNFANRVIQSMFDAKDKQRAENERRVDELVDEWSRGGKVERLH